VDWLKILRKFRVWYLCWSLDLEGWRVVWTKGRIDFFSFDEIYGKEISENYYKISKLAANKRRKIVGRV
jgi:hypothetical protein